MKEQHKELADGDENYGQGYYNNARPIGSEQRQFPITSSGPPLEGSLLTIGVNISENNNNTSMGQTGSSPDRHENNSEKVNQLASSYPEKQCDERVSYCHNQSPVTLGWTAIGSSPGDGVLPLDMAAPKDLLPPLAPHEMEWRIPNYAKRHASTVASTVSDALRSHIKKIDNFQFRIMFLPKGVKGPNDRDSMAVFVEAIFDESQPEGISFPNCSYSVFLPKYSNLRQSVYRTDYHSFSRVDNDRGYHNFVPERSIGRIEDWVFPDGSLVLRASVGVYQEGMRGSTTRRECGFIGLRNSGATCYMNSLLQSMYHTGKLTEAVYCMTRETDKEYLGEKTTTTESIEAAASSSARSNTSDEEEDRDPVTDGRKASVALALQYVFYKIKTSFDPVDCSELIRAFGWDSVEAFTQHDAQELSRLLCDKLDEQTKGTAVEGTVERLLQGLYENYVSCTEVDFTSKREEPFFDLSLDVKGHETLMDSLRGFVEEEMLEGENKYDTENLGKQNAKRGTRFLKFPPLLHFHLKRFQFDLTTMDMAKVNDRFEYPERLDLDSFVPNAGTYLLHTVVVHQGDLGSGHYYCFIRPHPSQQWHRFDDDSVFPVSEFAALNYNYGGNQLEAKSSFYENIAGQSNWKTKDHFHTTVPRWNAYMLVYVKETAVDSILFDTDPQVANEYFMKRMIKEIEEGKERARIREQLASTARIRVILQTELQDMDGTWPANSMDLPYCFEIANLKRDAPLTDLYAEIMERTNMRRDLFAIFACCKSWRCRKESDPHWALVPYSLSSDRRMDVLYTVSRDNRQAVSFCIVVAHRDFSPLFSSLDYSCDLHSYQAQEEWMNSPKCPQPRSPLWDVFFPGKAYAGSKSHPSSFCKYFDPLTGTMLNIGFQVYNESIAPNVALLQVHSKILMRLHEKKKKCEDALTGGDTTSCMGLPPDDWSGWQEDLRSVHEVYEIYEERFGTRRDFGYCHDFDLLNENGRMQSCTDLDMVVLSRKLMSREKVARDDSDYHHLRYERCLELMEHSSKLLAQYDKFGEEYFRTSQNANPTNTEDFPCELMDNAARVCDEQARYFDEKKALKPLETVICRNDLKGWNEYWKAQRRLIIRVYDADKIMSEEEGVSGELLRLSSAKTHLEVPSDGGRGGDNNNAATTENVLQVENMSCSSISEKRSEYERDEIGNHPKFRPVRTLELEADSRWRESEIYEFISAKVNIHHDMMWVFARHPFAYAATPLNHNYPQESKLKDPGDKHEFPLPKEASLDAMFGPRLASEPIVCYVLKVPVPRQRLLSMTILNTKIKPLCIRLFTDSVCCVGYMLLFLPKPTATFPTISDLIDEVRRHTTDQHRQKGFRVETSTPIRIIECPGVGGRGPLTHLNILEPHVSLKNVNSPCSFNTDVRDNCYGDHAWQGSANDLKTNIFFWSLRAERDWDEATRSSIDMKELKVVKVVHANADGRSFGNPFIITVARGATILDLKAAVFEKLKMSAADVSNRWRFFKRHCFDGTKGFLKDDDIWDEHMRGALSGQTELLIEHDEPHGMNRSTRRERALKIG